MHYDIVIVGAGLTGSLIAHALCQLPYRTLWVAPDWAPPQNTLRRLGLTAKTLSILKEWNVKPQVAPVQRLSVVMNRHRLLTLQGNPTLGGHVSWTELHQSIFEAQDRALPRERSFVCSLTRDSHDLVLEFDNKRKVKASFVIGADGKDSVVRKALVPGDFSYNITGQVAHTLFLEHQPTLGSPHAYQIGWREFLVGVLPLGQGQSMAVLTGPVSLMQNLQPHDLLGILSPFLPCELLPLRAVKILGTNTLVEGVCFPQYGENFVLLGDAAKVWHPAAAMGLNHTIFEMNVLKDIWKLYRKSTPLNSSH